VYQSDAPLYALSFKNTEDTEELTFAVGTNRWPPTGNKVEIVQVNANGFTQTHYIPIDYPPTKL
jgi:hypothetical protein